MSFKDLFHAIPDNGALVINLERKGDRMIAGIKRDFPGCPDLQPLVLSGSIEEFEQEFVPALNQYRRSTSIAEQAAKTSRSIERGSSKKPDTQPSKKGSDKLATASDSTVTDDDGEEMKLTGEFAD